MSEGQGTLTSPTLTLLLREGVAALYPDVWGNLAGPPAAPSRDRAAGEDKVVWLEAVLRTHGAGAVVELGRRIRQFRGHPVVQALVAARQPAGVLERWGKLERFGHSRNRTRLVSDEHDDDWTELTVVHVAEGGGSIAVVNDLFVWGLLLGLLEMAGARRLSADLVRDEAASTTLLLSDESYGELDLTEPTHTVRFRLRTQLGHPSSVPVEDSSPADQARARLATLVEGDLLHSWVVADVARAFGMSTRTLQRRLGQEGTSFSDVIHRTRVRRAHQLVTDSTLSLTEIAFCTGFADQAHFARTFRRYADVPPSALRGL